MPGPVCLFEAVALNANQEGTRYLTPDPNSHVHSFHFQTRSAATPVYTPVSNSVSVGYIHCANMRPKYFRARWDLAALTLRIEGSETGMTGGDDWATLGFQAIVVGAATHLWVKTN